MIQRIGLIARREFVATAGRKGFLIGLLIMPVMLGGLVLLGPRILASRTPQVHGEVAVVDRTGTVLAPLKLALDPQTIEARRAEGRRRATDQVAPGFGPAASQNIGPPVPALQVIGHDPDSDLQKEKDWLGHQTEDAHRLALVVIHADAVRRDTGKPDFGSYDLYETAALDDATEGVIHEGLRQALVGERLKAVGFDPQVVEASTRVTRPNPVIVAATGEQQSRRGFNRALPFAMGFLLFMGVMMGGQTLMTSTIEEKSSRVVEVLLAAVSPLELMWGKLLGQLAIGLLVMSLYIGLGLLALFQFALLGLLDPMLVLYLLVFFLISYLVYGALMMAVGAAVNQIADAQSMMGPVMLLLVVPYAMSPIIGRAPNSLFSVVASFVPPVNSFVMLSRLASDSPPPLWQVLLTVLIGIGAASLAVWFAAKIFKIGLLMHGKPPGFVTLIRWARMA